MFSIIVCGFGFFAAVLCLPTAMLLIEILFARLPGKDDLEQNAGGEISRSAAVIIPARDESVGLIPTLNDLKTQLHQSDRLIVVADNCSDDTAAVAALAEAEVIVRNDPAKIGKGYALAYGIDFVAHNPPEFVIFIDADCRLQNSMVARLKRACSIYNCPIQACFLMKAADHSPTSHVMAEFAWIVKNWARPLGLWRLGLPVQLMGTGMIFPWRFIKDISLANGNLVEDLQLGLDLAASGHAPRFYPQVVGTSEFPQTAKGTDSQRQRWIQGQVSTIRSSAPKLLLSAITTRNWHLLVLLLDLAVPPISMLITLIALSSIAGISLAAAGVTSIVAVISTLNLLALAIALWLAWLKFAREVLPPKLVPLIVWQLCRRLPFYFRVYTGRKILSWIRTDRAKG